MIEANQKFNPLQLAKVKRNRLSAIFATIAFILAAGAAYPLLEDNVLRYGYLALLLLIGTYVVNQYPLEVMALKVTGWHVTVFIFSSLGLAINGNALGAYWIISIISYLFIPFIKDFKRIKDVVFQQENIYLFFFLGWTIFRYFQQTRGIDTADTRFQLIFLLMVPPYFGGILWGAYPAYQNTLQQFFKSVIIIQLAIGLYFVFSGLQVSDYRVVAGGINPLSFSYGIALGGLLLTFYGLPKLKKDYLFLSALIFFFTIYLIALTDSRGPLIAFILSYALALYLKLDFYKSYFLTLIGASLAIAALSYFVAQDLLSDRYFELISSLSLNYESIQGDLIRLNRSIWIDNIVIWQNNFLWGGGLGASFGHNWLTEVLAEEGIVGLALFITFLVFVVRKAVSLFQQMDTLLSIPLIITFFFSLLMYSFSGNLQSATIFWVTCGLFIGLHHQMFQKRHDKKRT